MGKKGKSVRIFYTGAVLRPIFIILIKQTLELNGIYFIGVKLACLKTITKSLATPCL